MGVAYRVTLPILRNHENAEDVAQVTLGKAQRGGRIEVTRDVGAVETNKLAELIAVPGDPLKDISQSQHVTFVMKGDQVYKQ